MKKLLSLAAAVVLLLSAAALPAAKAGPSGENGVWLDFSTATDEELEDALAKIRAE